MLMTITPPSPPPPTQAPLTAEERKRAEAWFQFLRAFVVTQEHVPKIGWRVSQQSMAGTRGISDTSNLFVVQKMDTPVGVRYFEDVRVAIAGLTEEHHKIVLWIRTNGERSYGRGCVPVTLYHPELGSPTRRARDEIARACLALALLLDNMGGKDS